MPNYTISGRVVDIDGNPQSSVAVTVYERFDLTTDNVKVAVSTDSNGRYVASWTEASTPATPWDLFVEAVVGPDKATSALISELASTATADLVVGSGAYQGLSEWARVKAKVDPLLGATLAKDTPVDRLEWLARRADVFPTHLGAYVQAHRLADGRTVKPETCYALLRAGLPADLPGLLRSGEAAWEGALRSGWSQRVVDVPGTGTPSELDTEVTRERDALRELVVEAAITQPSSGVNQRSLFDTAGLSQSDQQTFAEDWLARTGDVATFWSDLTNTLDATRVATFQFTIQAAALVSNDLSTLTGLQAERTAANISTVSDLSAWSSTDWDNFLVNRTVTVPSDVPGANSTEQRQNYAAGLARAVEDAYPTDFFRHSLARDEAGPGGPANTTHISTFLVDNPDFDLVASTVGVYLDGATDPWKNTLPADEAAARANLARLQRLYRLTPRMERYATVKVLLDGGLGSAAEIVDSTKEEFVAKYGPLLPAAPHDPDALAGKIWTNAAKVHSTTISLASQLALAKTKADPTTIAMPGGEQFAGAANGLSELEAILGDLDYCACEHCRSVLSPAAYLADLLAFLAGRDAVNQANALEAMSLRRPDIRHILLDCANTNTVLPHIDLVNELLEAELGATRPPWPQTTWQTEELRVHPEHTQANIYDGLLTKVHPWTLPFSLPTAEARVYLDHLGVSRADVMRTFAKVIPSATQTRDLAGEVLGLNATEAEIVAGEYTGNASTDDREFWGFVAVVDDNWVSVLNGTDPTDGDIGELLRRGGYTLDELREYLAFDFVDPGENVAFQWDDSCDLSAATIAFLDAPVLDRLHRFTRLQRRCRIPARMLNVLLVDVFAGTLDATTLEDLADIVAVRDRLHLDWDELATFWASVIDYRTYESGARPLFERRVHARDLVIPSQFDVTSGELLGAGSGDLSDHMEIVLSAIGASEAEFDALEQSELAADPFNFANLTAFMRCVLLMRALKLGVEDFVVLAGAGAMTAIDPFSSPRATLDFIDGVEGIRESGLTVPELDWLLRDEGDSDLDSEAIGRALAELARALATIEHETSELTDPDGVALGTNLEELLDGADQQLIDIVDLTSAETIVDQQQRVEDKLGPYMDAALAKRVLVDDSGANDPDPDYEPDVAKRRGWLLGRVISFQRRRALVVDSLAAAFDVGASVADKLAFTLLTDPSITPTPPALGTVFLEVFADEAQIAAGIDVSTHPAQFLAWIRAAKAAALCRHHDLDADEVEWYSARGAWLDFDALPIETGDPDATFDAWNRLRLALGLRSMFRPGELAHAEIVAAATFTDAIAAFASHRGWSATALEFVANTLGWANVSELESERPLIRLRAIAEMGDRIGVDVDAILGWVENAPSANQATAIKATARAKHDEAEWLEVAAPLRDAIREQQRDALVDAVLAASATLRDRDDVFDHLLIDTQMSACMQTTRIKQAITSVQIYIQRVLLHLEKAEVEFGKEAIARWEWMKNYRVWEANRKVFLYPENWLEPELRLDKTPEFDGLESVLMQGVLDESRVEKALVGYLEQLDRVSRLEIVSLHEGASGLWLLGRTAGTPHDWFVRRQTNAGDWLPWEEVPNKIDADAVTLVVMGDRVHLFWANSQEGKRGENDPEKWSYRLSHCERTDDGWTKTITSETSYPMLGVEDPGKARLQILPREPQIYIAVLTNAADNEVAAPAGFVFDSVERAIRYLPVQISTSGFEMGGEGEASMLVSKASVALQGGYDIDAQRYRRWADAVFPGTIFRQGSLEYQIFNSRSVLDIPQSLVHEPDFWMLTEEPRYEPVVYDDTQRKFLLVPKPVFENVGDGGGDPNPAIVGAVDLAPYYDDCPPPAAGSLPLLAPLTEAQQLKDGITKVLPWTDGIPGVVVSQGLAKGNEFNVPANGGLKLLNKAEGEAAAGVGVQDVENPFPVDPESFTLSFEALYHPYSRQLVEALATKGVTGIYPSDESAFAFRQDDFFDPFAPDVLDINEAIVDDVENLPDEVFDFRHTSPYGPYNWELFFHVPMLIAAKLTAEQRFEEAQRWHHRIFNPIDVVSGETGPSRFWRLKPFVEQADQITKDQFEVMLGIGVTPAQQQAAIADFSAQVDQWLKHPFDPHAIARIRPGVYQRALMRKYFDNLIAWADNLFRRDTIESINEATVLYVLISQLLGDRPREVPGNDTDAKTFDELDGAGLDAFTNALIELEGWIHLPPAALDKQGCDPATDDDWVRVPTISRFWYFCYPPNRELLKYWDIVEDRLWKIRHCQNIEGVTRTLPIFQPPIDPGLLVRATAAGVDIQSVLAELDSGLPPYRFRSVHARAMAFTGSLRALGSELLAALEKQDAEKLSQIRSTQELDMLERVRAVRVRQIDEAERQLESLRKAKGSVVQRRDRYADWISDGLNGREEKHFDLAKRGHQMRQIAGSLTAVGGFLGAIPQLIVGPTGGTEFGGNHFSNVFSAVAGVHGLMASEFDFRANKAQLQASFLRREQDWQLQKDQANKDLARIEQDILAAEIRLAIAQRELDNHDLQVEQSTELDREMREKFSNRELYNWMVGQLSTVYFQTYQLAYDLAKRAERAYRHELAIDSSEPPIIKYGYWDSLQKGLLSGTRLQHDLERLDLAYMDRDIREFELRKSVSLAELAPAELRKLQEDGACAFSIPELLYDLDHPGHYLRRIKSVRLTIPAVVGPYTSLGARLELDKHHTRAQVTPNSYSHADALTTGFGGGEAIATSTAVADGGLFNLDFRDERYLPFEYAGAVSEWKLTLPATSRQFDYRTISDVVIHIDYTARDGGETLRGNVETAVSNTLSAGVSAQPFGLVIAVHDAFPNEWEQFFADPGAGNDQVLTLPITPEHFGYLAERSGVDVSGIDFALLVEEGVAAGGTLDVTCTMQAGTITLADNGTYMSNSATANPEVDPTTWELRVAENAAPNPGLDDGNGRLDRSKIAGLIAVVRYTVK